MPTTYLILVLFSFAPWEGSTGGVVTIPVPAGPAACAQALAEMKQQKAYRWGYCLTTVEPAQK